MNLFQSKLNFDEDVLEFLSASKSGNSKSLDTSTLPSIQPVDICISRGGLLFNDEDDVSTSRDDSSVSSEFAAESLQKFSLLTMPLHISDAEQINAKSSSIKKASSPSKITKLDMSKIENLESLMTKIYKSKSVTQSKQCPRINRMSALEEPMSRLEIGEFVNKFGKFESSNMGNFPNTPSVNSSTSVVANSVAYPSLGIVTINANVLALTSSNYSHNGIITGDEFVAPVNESSGCNNTIFSEKSPREAHIVLPSVKKQYISTTQSHKESASDLNTYLNDIVTMSTFQGGAARHKRTVSWGDENGDLISQSLSTDLTASYNNVEFASLIDNRADNRSSLLVNNITDNHHHFHSLELKPVETPNDLDSLLHKQYGKLTSTKPISIKSSSVSASPRKVAIRMPNGPQQQPPSRGAESRQSTANPADL